MRLTSPGFGVQFILGIILIAHVCKKRGVFENLKGE